MITLRVLPRINSLNSSFFTFGPFQMNMISITWPCEFMNVLSLLRFTHHIHRLAANDESRYVVWHCYAEAFGANYRFINNLIRNPILLLKFSKRIFIQCFSVLTYILQVLTENHISFYSFYFSGSVAAYKCHIKYSYF